MFHRLVFLFASGTVAAMAGVACSAPKDDAKPTKTTGPISTAGGKTTLSSSDSHDGGAVAMKDAGAAYDGPLIGALFLATPVMSEMEWPKDSEKRGEKNASIRIGYIRQGQKVPVIPEPHPKSNCKDGWYELLQGGFVCGKYASLDMHHPRIKLAPHAPDMTGSLPYQYGYNITNGTPLYRTVPSRDDRAKIEPWLAGGTRRAKPRPRASDEDTTVSNDDLDGGASVALTLTRAMTTPPPTTQDPFNLGEGAEDAGTPWYLREYDGGKPQVTLDDLKGEGPVARRMVKGFFVALDKEMIANGKWWRTTGSLLAPYDRIMVYKNVSEYHGVWLDQPDTPPTPVSSDGGTTREKKEIVDLLKAGSKAQVAILLTKAHKYIVSTSRKAVTTGDSVSRHTVVKLTGDIVNVNGAEYAETEDGWWLRGIDATRTKPGDVPKDLAPGEKWIDVNLTTQTLVAYEGEKPVFATAVSTGKKNEEDKEKDHRTPPGTFRIREKHIAATMDGDVASDGPYSIEDVPWIMYFNGSYALHGAFWHNNFGHTQSHGCVNLAPLDAKALFGWTEPRLPDGWHGVMATPEKQGTRVIVHE